MNKCNFVKHEFMSEKLVFLLENMAVKQIGFTIKIFLSIYIKSYLMDYEKS